MKQGPTWQNTIQDFGRISRFLHWFMGIWLLGQTAFGFYIANFMSPSPLLGSLFNGHKIAGVLFLIFLLFRIAWRLINVVPALPHYNAMLDFFSRCSASVLYAVMLIMPVSGYVMTSAAGRSIDFLGYWRIPMLIPPDKTIAWIAKQTHTYVAYVLIALIILHTYAAFYHHFILKDNVLRRIFRQT